MSALENGEAILDRIHMQFEMQNKERYSSLSDDDRLLSDLENTDDESSQVRQPKNPSIFLLFLVWLYNSNKILIYFQMDTEISTSVDTTKMMEANDSNSEFS